MFLVNQTERVVELSLSTEDADEYRKLETAARSAYTFLKVRTGRVGKAFLKISQILMPLRVACAGGRTPLRDPSDNVTTADSDDEDHDVAPGSKKKRTTPVQYSDYVYTSKLNKLIVELKRVRNEDSTGTTKIYGGGSFFCFTCGFSHTFSFLI